MWNVPSDKMLSALPKMGSTENIPLSDKKIFMHFFIGGADWYIAEYDPSSRTFFGYANLGDDEMAEWGNISFDELKSIRQGGIEIDRDTHWTTKKFKDIKK